MGFDWLARNAKAIPLSSAPLHAHLSGLFESLNERGNPPYILTLDINTEYNVLTLDVNTEYNDLTLDINTRYFFITLDYTST